MVKRRWIYTQPPGIAPIDKTKCRALVWRDGGMFQCRSVPSTAYYRVPCCGVHREMLRLWSLAALRRQRGIIDEAPLRRRSKPRNKKAGKRPDVASTKHLEVRYNIRKIEKAMKRKGIKTQIALSKLADVNRLTIWRLLNGKNVWLSTIARVARALDMTVYDLKVKP